jgi:hypothetical protein
MKMSIGYRLKKPAPGRFSAPRSRGLAFLYFTEICAYAGVVENWSNW